jgi:hypothetical protein
MLHPTPPAPHASVATAVAHNVKNSAAELLGRVMRRESTGKSGAGLLAGGGPARLL